MHAALLAVALGATALWFALGPRGVAAPKPHVDAGAQLARLAADPVAGARVIAGALWRRKVAYFLDAAARFGWVKLRMPAWAYRVVLLAVGLALLVRPETPPVAGATPVLWDLALVAGVALLVMVALYLIATPVGSADVGGVQGRYFLPAALLLGNAGVAAASGLRSRVAPSAGALAAERDARLAGAVVAASALLIGVRWHTLMMAYWHR